MSYEPKQPANQERVRELVAQKLDLSQKIRDLRSEMGNLNKQLLDAGAGIAELAAW